MNTSNGEETIFAGVLRLPAGERAAYLQENCGSDAGLKQRIEKLVKAYEVGGGFLENAIPPPARASAAAVSISEKPGDTIDRYKLLQQIGEGGGGVVYMAEQEEPVRRRVALKVIKLGMDTRSVIARFKAERQALAMMDHPNIAKVLDAGATEAGRPYFVMELVRGIKITDFCDQNNLSTPDRLDLFMQVCRAIQHAHQKGIIHRDIKPSNILVTLHDGVPVPKVIDFGIAKATQGRLTDGTLFTAFEQFIGTPAYTSPEQAEMSAIDIDTRSDIYSLGVLLYELLTGKTPFETKELLAAGLDEMRRTIREREPERPSNRLSTMLAGELTATATRRQTEPPKLIHLMRGDLDWIVMRCLEKDRTRRYDTANDLASDVQRYLKQEPVLACPPSGFYRLRKLAARNKAVFIAAGIVSMALFAGLSISTSMFIREKEARQRASAAELTQTRLRQESEIARNQAEAEKQKAQTAATKSEQISHILKDMLKSAGPSVAGGRDTKLLKEILDKTAERIGRDLTNEPLVEIELRTVLAQTYGDLGLLKPMEEMARKNLELARTQLGEEHLVVASALDQLGDALTQLGDQIGAETLIRQALWIRKKLLGDEHPVVAESLSHLAFVLRRQRRLPEAEMTQREALAMQEKLLGHENLAVATSLYRLALVLQRQSKMESAVESHRKALAIRRKLSGNKHPDVAESLDTLAALLLRQGELPEAEKVQREALEIRKELFGNEHLEVVESLAGLALVLTEQGKFAAAEALHQEALALRKKLSGDEHPGVATLLHNLGVLSQRQGDLPEAEIRFSRALELRRKLLGNNNPHVAATLNCLAKAIRDQSRPAEAETLFNDSLFILHHQPPNDRPPERRLLELSTLNQLVSLLEERNALAEAKLLGEEAVAIYRAHLHLPSKDGETAFRIIREVLTNLNDFERLDALWRERLQTFRVELGPNHPKFTAGLEEFAFSLLSRERFSDAEIQSRECLTIREQKFPDDWQTFSARGMLGICLLGQRKYADAEPLLISGYEGLLRRQDRIPDSGRLCVKLILRNLVQFYEATNRSAQAMRWKTETIRWYGKDVEARCKAADEGDVQAVNDLAWLLATCVADEVRDGRKAVALAEKAVSKTNRKSPDKLGTLAAAYAECSQFTEAVRAQKEAIALLQGDRRKKALISRLALYESHRPYREP